MISTLRLFKALPVDRHTSSTEIALVEDTVRKGFILSPDVIALGGDVPRIIEQIEGLYGADASKLNQAFHKSWGKVKNAPIAQLALEQIVHYITTYGFEDVGIFSHDSVYVPGEVLKAPELKDGLRLVVIRGLTKDELRRELLALLGSGVALSETTIKDALDVATFVGFTEADLALVRNREAQAALCTYLGIVPANPVDFLRFAVYKATGQTLLIKSRPLIEQIAECRSLEVTRAFELYEKSHGLTRLGEVFYRFKPLFLAFRTSARMRQIINEIRRSARTNHRPMAADPLNEVTARLARGANVDLSPLDDVNTFRKVRLAYALKYRMGDPDSILYRVRNGKTWATEFRFPNPAAARTVYDEVMASIVSDLSRNVARKTIHIPKGVHYALPATERQFTGNLPSGTYVEAKKHIVCGIHWTNIDDHRVDLDLSMLAADFKFGWDSAYRSSDGELLFSGDMTDAPPPNGASEFYFLGDGLLGAYLLVCNFYNFDPAVKVPTQLVVAKQKSADSGRRFVADPNRILAASHLTMDVKQKVLGIAVAAPEYRRFYFAEFNQGGRITSDAGGHSEIARRFLLSYYLDAIDLTAVLNQAGATLVDDPAIADLDLRPEAVDKTTFIRLLDRAGGDDTRLPGPDPEPFGSTQSGGADVTLS